MNPVIRGVVIYVFLLVLFRIMGKRSMSEVTTFDFVLLLIIGEATQQGLLGDDFSITNALLVILTLICIDMILSFFKKNRTMDILIEGIPLVIVDHGKPLRDRMKKSRIDDDDILEAAREVHGLEKMSEIKYAVLEKDGNISIIPFERD